MANPVKYRDPSGHWVETAFDIISIGFDIAAVRQDPSLLNVASLAVDVGAAVLPFVPAGAGWVARGGKAAVEIAGHADDVVDAVKAVSKAEDVANAAADAAKLAHSADTVGDIAQAGAAPSRATTILGENMRDRVIPFAEATGARTLPFGTTADKWAAMTPKERWHLNDGALRKRIGEGDQFRYIGIDPDRPGAVRQRFDLTRSELLRLEERGIDYETVPWEEIMRVLGRP